MNSNLTSAARVVIAYKRRVVKRRVKRSPSERLKARLYYRRNKIKLKIKRNRYLQRSKIFHKTKKLFKRSVPSWLGSHKSKAPTIHKPTFKKFKFNVPKRHK